MKITLISDTHNKHKKVKNLPGGDLLLHAGDISSKGYEHEIKSFCKWFDGITGYDHKIFIAGNHDFMFEREPERALDIVNQFDSITYLMDESLEVWADDYERKIKIYGSPWQPRFHDWAFNINRDSDAIEEKWNQIPDDVDILITHGPMYGVLDFTMHWGLRVGCERLEKVLPQKSPLIHVFGHIHEDYGWKSKGDTHHFNASCLDLSYNVVNDPFNIEWNYKTNRVKFL